MELYSSPNHGGKRGTTKGVVVHSTRSGKDVTPQQEYKATINHFMNPSPSTEEHPEGDPSAAVSAHIVIGTERGYLAKLVEPDYEAWHCRELNQTMLGVELVQAHATDEFTAFQYVTLANLVKAWSLKYGFPLDRAHIVGHEETVPGKRDHKSDPGKMFDWDRFMSIVEAL